MACLETVDGDVTLSDLRDLVSLAGLEWLRSVGRRLRISNAPNVSDLTPLSALTSARGVDIESTAVTNLRGLGSLTSVGRLLIAYNPELVDIEAISGLTEFPDGLDILGNPRLSELAGLRSCTRVGGLGLTIGGNAVTHLDDLSSLVELSSLSLSGEALRSVAGLNGVRRIDGSVYLGSTGLSDFGGLELVEIGDRLTVSNNANLTVGDGINGDLEIQSNVALTDIGGLRSLTRVDRVFRFRDNTALCRSSIEALLSTVNAATAPDPLADVMGNRTGC